MNLEQLVKEATQGTLSPKQLRDVVACLESGTCDEYQALLVIGRAGAIEYRPLVEKYLAEAARPMLARLALLILCRYWKLTREYKPVLESFLRGVEWDDEDDVRVLAISITGSLLAEERHDTLLELLLEIFENTAEPEPQLLREVAYSALAVASGKSLRELPPASRHLDFQRELDPEVIAYIEEARRRISTPDRNSPS